MIAVTVGHKQFVRLRMHPHIRRPVQIPRIGITFALIAPADLHHQLSFLREL